MSSHSRNPRGTCTWDVGAFSAHVLDADVSPSSFIAEFCVHVGLALLFGAILDNLVRYVIGRLAGRSYYTSLVDAQHGRRAITPRDRLIAAVSVVVQVALNIVLMWSAVRLVPPCVYLQWQTTVTGLSFSAVFFGVQNNLFGSMRTAISFG